MLINLIGALIFGLLLLGFLNLLFKVPIRSTISNPLFWGQVLGYVLIALVVRDNKVVDPIKLVSGLVTLQVFVMSIFASFHRPSK